MALIKCPECGKEISDQAPACPNCGYPMQSSAPNVSDDAEYDNIIAELLSQNNNNKILTIKALMRSTGISMTEAKKQSRCLLFICKKCISSSAHCTFCH